MAGGYPLGAENDPSAPYNQKSIDQERIIIKAKVCDSGFNESDLHIVVIYSENEEEQEIFIHKYQIILDNGEWNYDHDDVIREEIKNHFEYQTVEFI